MKMLLGDYQEKLLREYTDGEQTIQEFEVVTPSGKRHIVRRPAQPHITPEPSESLEDKLARVERTQDILLMMMLEREGIL